MRFTWHFKYLEHRNAIGQEGIEASCQFFSVVQVLFCVKMGVARCCMYPCICSSLSCSANLLSTNNSKRLLDTLLYRSCVFLALPTMKVGSFVGEVKKIPRHFLALFVNNCYPLAYTNAHGCQTIFYMFTLLHFMYQCSRYART